MINKYIYVLNNPINAIDPSGMFLKGLWNSIKRVTKKVMKNKVAGLIISSVLMGPVGALAYVNMSGEFHQKDVAMINMTVAVAAAAATGGAAGAWAGGLAGGGAGGAAAGALAGAVTGAVVGGTINGALTDLNGGSFRDGFISGAISGAIAGGLAGMEAGYNASNGLNSSGDLAEDTLYYRTGDPVMCNIMLIIQTTRFMYNVINGGDGESSSWSVEGTNSEGEIINGSSCRGNSCSPTGDMQMSCRNVSSGRMV